MKASIKAALNWVSAPLFWRQTAKTWTEIANTRGQRLQEQAQHIATLQHQLEYHKGLVREHDNILAMNIRDMKAAKSLARQWRQEAEALTDEKNAATLHAVRQQSLGA